MTPYWVCALAGLFTACQPREVRPEVTYVAVEVRPTQAHVRGTSISVEITLDTKTAMPHVAPHVEIAARCDDKTDKDKAFFMSLGDAQPGERKADTVEMFRVSSLDGAPKRCDLTLQLSEGMTAPASYCYENGVTRAGRCG